MKLWQATVCRVVLNPPRSQAEEVLIHAKTAQAAGRLLKRAYPGWERIRWAALSDSPIVMHLKTLSYD